MTQLPSPEDDVQPREKSHFKQFLLGLFAKRRVTIGLLFGGFFLLMSLWSVISPIGSGNDEPAQIVKAAGVAHGNLVGKHINPLPDYPVPVTAIYLPSIFKDVQSSSLCFVFIAPLGNRAVCEFRFLNKYKGYQYAWTYMGAYPPTYYFVTGLPTDPMPTHTGLVVMREWNIAINSALLTAAVMSLAFLKKRTFTLIGLLLALTPTVIYYGSVINASGAEIDAAICAWTTAMAIGSDPLRAPRGLIAKLGISASYLCLDRVVSPIWALAIGVVMFLLMGRGVIDFLKRRVAQFWLLIVAFAGISTAIWAALAPPLVDTGKNNIPHYFISSSPLYLLKRAFHDQYGSISMTHQMVGIFSWDTIFAPSAVVAIWVGAVGVLLLASFLYARKLNVVPLVLLIIATVAIPVILEADQIRWLTDFWQGRYSLPIVVGVPILAGFLIDKHSGDQRTAVPKLLIGATFLIFIISQIACIYTALKVFEVGQKGSGPVLFHYYWYEYASSTPWFYFMAIGAVIFLSFGIWTVAYSSKLASNYELKRLKCT
ncbi:MAG: DUF2142 domain-containing protein [Acidimicrobiales bacterium]|nr:DUF2142 domain-containing protein [Acidimicrobiales bacterium]